MQRHDATALISMPVFSNNLDFVQFAPQTRYFVIVDCLTHATKHGYIYVLRQ